MLGHLGDSEPVPDVTATPLVADVVMSARDSNLWSSRGLFLDVRRVRNGQVRIDGLAYPMGRHCFAVRGPLLHAFCNATVLQ